MIKEELKGEIKWVSPFMRSKKGGYFRTVILKLVNYECSKQTKVYLDPDCRNYKNWEPLLTEGNIITGLIWKNASEGLIDADSPVRLA